jgi:hypothetical protein
MSEQRCGTCKWFLEVRKASRNIAAGGKCIWHPPFNRTYDLPNWIKKAERYISADEGRECETWHAK